MSTFISETLVSTLKLYHTDDALAEDGMPFL